MALSDDEQRLLDQLEAALAAEDPKLANTLRGNVRQWDHRRLVLAGLGFVIGVVALIGGMEIHPLVSVAGFLIMLACAALSVAAWQRSVRSADPGAPGGSNPEGLSGKSEDRWRKNQDDGF